MNIKVLEEINDKIHIRDGLNYYMDYFTNKYDIKRCMIRNEKDGNILYEKNNQDYNYDFVIKLRKNTYEEIDLYINKKLQLEQEETKKDFEILRLMVSNVILYHSILSLSKSRLQKQKQVETLMEISRELIFLRKEKNIFNSFIFAVMGQVMISKVGIYLSEDERKFKLKHQKGFVNLPETLNLENKIDKVIDLTKKETREKYKNLKRLKSQDVNIVVPMQYLQKTKGLAVLGYKMDKEHITKTDFDFLFSLATNVIFAVENSKLIQESIEKKRMEQELELATDIQRNILPKNLPEVRCWDVYGKNIPSREVGGDYFYVKKVQDKLCLVIADVTGKSVPAALLVSTLHSAFSILTQNKIDLIRLVERLNYLIYNNTSMEQFITFFAGYIDIDNNEMRYINSGHNPPFVIYKDGTINDLSKGGRILGISENYECEEGFINIENISLLALYTDGITEATNNYGEEFGVSKLKKLILENQKQPAKEIIDILINNVNDFKSNETIQDDMTLLITKKKQKGVE
ncbi:MAG: PP2C family protein-serine/threonine phosphatase [Candidatus Mcinerneyibacterium aminivorans]|uniref:PP2C family protein-serine/threonine phosphatase n=1 Tax=Candidatus Mcinerneyibacterium aminivorans TaxID=2703815 RepID=A0A5D0MD24_9BACT|nr:MAG: PP2C family protein-serine/threonine phosphatase [Candidatus Mcinerneyibacterium aminivorans]